MPVLFTPGFSQVSGVDVCDWKPFKRFPSAVPPQSSIEDTEPKTTAVVRRFLMQLASGSAIDKDLVTPGVTTELTPARSSELATTLNSLTLPIALFHSEELIERRTENELRVYRYFFNDIPKTLSLTVKLTKDDKIASFDLVEAK